MKIIKLDYTISSPEERNELVKKILEENPDPSPKYLEILADYLIMGMDRQERRERKIITENRKVTIDKRETSFEGLVNKFENGEDGIYNILNENKYTLLQPKVSITKKDLEEIPLLKQLHDSIEFWEGRMKVVEGHDAYIIKRTLIDLRKDQYLIKAAYRRPVTPTKIIHSKSYIPLDGYNELKVE